MELTCWDAGVCVCVCVCGAGGGCKKLTCWGCWCGCCRGVIEVTCRDAGVGVAGEGGGIEVTCRDAGVGVAGGL